MPQFDGKKVRDVGAWVSDFLKLIWKYSHPSKRVIIDPIYDDVASYERSIKLTRELLDGYIRTIRNQATNILNTRTKLDASCAAVMRSYYKLKDRKRLIQEATFRAEPGIEYASFLEELEGGKADFIFMSFLFYFHPYPGQLLSQVYSNLEDNGQLIITDFMHRGNIRKLREINEWMIQILWEDHTWGFCALQIFKDDIPYISMS